MDEGYFSHLLRKNVFGHTHLAAGRWKEIFTKMRYFACEFFIFKQYTEILYSSKVGLAHFPRWMKTFH